MTMIDGHKMVGTGFPTDEGRRLAELLLRDGTQMERLEVDLTQCDSGLLISAFFNAFLQAMHEKGADFLDKARKISWRLEFDFQRRNVSEWMQDFQPYTMQ